MAKKTNNIELNENELIVYNGLRHNPDMPVEHLAHVIAKQDPDETGTPEAWSHRIRRFKKKFPKWNDENFATKNLSALQGEQLLANRELTNKVRLLQTKLSAVVDDANKKIMHYQNIADIIPKLPVIKDVSKLAIPRTSGKIYHEDVVLMLSDAHINRVINLDQMEGFNEYNFDIFANRYWFLLRETLKIVNAQRYDKTIETLYIDCLGDMFNDIHREENMRSNQFSPVQALLMGAYVLAQGVALVIPHFKKVVFTGIVGNEPRWDKTKPAKDKFNNMDYDAYHFMSMALRDYIASGRLEFNIPVSPEVVVNRVGKKFLLTHGDAIKSSLGFPAYGVNRDFAKQQALRRKQGGFDFMELGHFHQEYVLAGTILMNSSMCGVDEYAKNDLHVTGNPTQKLFGINPKYGVSWSYDIQLQNAHENSFVYDTRKIDNAGVGAVWNDFLEKNPKFDVENTLKEFDIFNNDKNKRIAKKS